MLDLTMVLQLNHGRRHMSVKWRWRVLAGCSLVLLSAFVAVAVLFTFRNILLLLVTVITAALVVYASWMVLSGSGRRSVWGWLLLVASSLLLVAATARLFTKEKNLKLLLCMCLMGALYVLLISRLRVEYWRQKRRTGHGISISSYHHPVLIINPKSGDGRAIKARIPERARAMGIKVRVLKRGEDVGVAARQAVAEGADVLGVSGGDGSLGAVAAVAMHYDMPMVVLPGGTRCHFARDLGMGPKRIADALASFNGVERRVDVGDINGRIFLNNASFGLYAAIVDRPEYREHKLAAARTVIQQLARQSSSYDLQFTDVHGVRHEQAVSLLVGVNEYDMVDLLELGYRKQLDGGVLQVSAMTALSGQPMRQLLSSRKSVHTIQNMPDFLQWVTKVFRVTSRASSLVVGVDGEREEYIVPVMVTIKPGALRLLVPAEGIRPRQRRAADSEIIHKLRQAVSEDKV